MCVEGDKIIECDLRAGHPICLVFIHKSTINQSINLYRAIVQRHMLQCGYAESKRNVLRQIINVLTDGAVRQFSSCYQMIDI